MRCLLAACALALSVAQAAAMCQPAIVGNGVTDDYPAIEACRVQEEAAGGGRHIFIPHSPTGQPICVKSTITLQAEGTVFECESPHVQLSACGSGQGVIHATKGTRQDVRDSSQGTGQQLLRCTTLGKGADGTNGWGATDSVTRLGPDCNDCVVRDWYSYGGAHAFESNAGEPRVNGLIGCCSFGSSTFLIRGAGGSTELGAEPLAGGQFYHAKPDQDNYPVCAPSAERQCPASLLAGEPRYSNAGAPASWSSSRAAEPQGHSQLKTMGPRRNPPACPNYNRISPTGARCGSSPFPIPTITGSATPDAISSISMGLIPAAAPPDS